MMRGMFAAISGLKTHQVMLDVTANDIANVNTIGYKASRATFKDSLAQLQSGAAGPGGGLGGQNAAQVGLGVQLGSIDNLMSGGTFQATGNLTDLAIQGDGMFVVGSGAPPALPGTLQYTRAGNFKFSSTGFLTTQEGLFVVGRAAAGPGAPDSYIQVPPDSTDVSIGQDGSVSYVPAGGGPRVTAGYISIATFANDAGLQRMAGNRWAETASSGVPAYGTPGGGFGLTVTGTVEMSNVDLANEFTDMIAAQRGFQANSRVISTSDEMLQDLVNLKR
jgi:flagellar hook protein FlgE